MSTDSDDQLGARLDTALRAGLASDDVDVERLLTGSRRRAGRIRNRRISAGVAAAVVLIGVPAGVEILRPSDGVDPSAVLLGSAEVPAGFGLSASELPAGLALVADRRSSTLPVVTGPNCRPGDHQETAGRQWVWRSSGNSAISVRLTVTHWKAGAAPRRLGALSQARDCAVAGAQPAAFPGGPSGLVDQTWSASPPEDDAGSGRAAVRVGDWITGVEVLDPAGPAAAVALAQKLALAQVNRYAGHVGPTK